MVVRIADGGNRDLAPDDFLVLAQIAFLRAIEGDLPAKEFFQGFRVPVDMVGVGDLLEGEGGQLPFGVPQHSAERRIGPDEMKVGVGHGHAERPLLEDPPEALLAFPKDIFRPLFADDDGLEFGDPFAEFQDLVIGPRREDVGGRRGFLFRGFIALFFYDSLEPHERSILNHRDGKRIAFRNESRGEFRALFILSRGEKTPPRTPGKGRGRRCRPL